MSELAGIGRTSRAKFSQLKKAFGEGPFSVSQAREVLGLKGVKAARFLTNLSLHGWAKRIRRGHYFLISAEANDPNPIVEDPWLTAASLFSPCYVSGWSAAEHWGFTEQIFRSIYVVTAKKTKRRSVSVGGAEFILRNVSPRLIFGTKTIWRGKIKTQVADPSKLIVDLLDSPQCGGGISHSIQILKAYLKSEHRSLEKLLQYAISQGNKTILKRLGYLLEKLASSEKTSIEKCRELLSAGYSQLDPQIKGTKIVTRWKLWIPTSVEEDLKP